MVAVAVGLAVAVVIGFVASVPSGIAAGLAAGLVIGTTAVFFLTTTPTQTVLLETVVGLTSGLAGGLGFGIAAGINRRQGTLTTTHSLGRQISGVIIAVFVGIGTGFLASIGSNSTLLSALVVGFPFGLALWARTSYWQRGLIAGLLAGAVATLVGNQPSQLTANPWGIAFGLLLICAQFALPYIIAERLAGPWSGTLAGALGSGAGFYFFIASSTNLPPLLLFGLLGILVGLTLAWWRPILFYPFLTAWNRLLLRLDQQRQNSGTKRPLFRYHSAFWDEQQRLPSGGSITICCSSLSNGQAAAKPPLPI